jgi:hypothetical protein
MSGGEGYRAANDHQEVPQEAGALARLAPMNRGVRALGVSLVIGMAAALVPASASAVNLAFNPTSLNFGGHQVGTSSTMTTMLTVSCDAGCMMGPPMESYNPNFLAVAPDDFNQDNNCDEPMDVFPMAPASCTITVTFKPLANGAISGLLYDVGGSPSNVSLSGSGFGGPQSTSGSPTTTKTKCKAKKKKKKKRAAEAKKKKKKKCRKKKQKGKKKK